MLLEESEQENRNIETGLDRVGMMPCWEKIL